MAETPDRICSEASDECDVHFTCANSECRAHLHRMGSGKLYAFPVDDPKGWGLPGHLKQKVVWLCADCAEAMYVRLDRRHHRVQIVHRHAHGRQHRAA